MQLPAHACTEQLFELDYPRVSLGVLLVFIMVFLVGLGRKGYSPVSHVPNGCAYRTRTFLHSDKGMTLELNSVTTSQWGVPTESS